MKNKPTLIQDEKMISYCHSKGSTHIRFIQFEKDPVPKWATDIRPYVAPVELNTIDTKQAYEWVKTGHWDLKQFQKWHEACINAVY
jgi:hypothetical protein